jgi:hypothetical protein
MLHDYDVNKDLDQSSDHGDNNRPSIHLARRKSQQDDLFDQHAWKHVDLVMNRSTALQV